MNQIEKAELFGTLHRKGNPVILYNIWDAGTAKAVTEAGAKALATGSWSVAAANGYGDGQKLPMDVLIETARSITAVNDLPLSVDFEGGYSTEPAGAAANVAKLARISSFRKAMAPGMQGWSMRRSSVARLMRRQAPAASSCRA